MLAGGGEIFFFRVLTLIHSGETSDHHEVKTYVIDNKFMHMKNIQVEQKRKMKIFSSEKKIFFLLLVRRQSADNTI